MDALEPPEPPDLPNVAASPPAADSNPAAGWRPDPKDPAFLRYWDGHQWTAHVAPAMQPQPPRRTRSTAGLASAVIWLAVSETALGLSILPFSWAFERSSAFDAASVVYGVIAIATAINIVAGYVVGCLWLWRARANVEALRPEASQTRSAGWIWAGWITPVVFLWFPFQIVRDIGTAPAGTPNGPRRPPRLGLWWTFWIISLMASQVSLRLALVDEPWARRISFETDLAVALLTLAAALLWIPIVRYIDADQADLMGLPPSPRRRIPEFVTAGVAAVALLGTGAVVVTAPPFFGSSPGPRFEIPAVGECRALTDDDLEYETNETATVPCSQAHTALTFDVGIIPWDMEGDERYDVCSHERLDKLVGVDHRLTSVEYTYFVPNDRQVEQGAHWYRCDMFVTSEDESELTELPDDSVLVADSTTSRFVYCDAPDPKADENAEFVDRLVVMCSEPHDATATLIAEIRSDDEWPGEDAASQLASDACEDALKTSPDKFSFSSPTEEWWTESETVDIICYLYDDERDRTADT